MALAGNFLIFIAVKQVAYAAPTVSAYAAPAYAAPAYGSTYGSHIVSDQFIIAYFV